ncbi:MAG: ribonuclease HII [Clostridia bacterium]|nr:ribonuclease HII [Clostridia bacterium]
MSFSKLKNHFFSNTLDKCSILLEEHLSYDYFRKSKNLLDNETDRLHKLRKYENFLVQAGNKYIAGVDEAGRGPLAGPIVAGSVILPNDLYIFGINDSKKLSASKRELLFDKILSNCIAASIHTITNKQIDDINISRADKLAMKSAIEKLKNVPDHVLTDAFVIDDLDINQTAVIHGDALSITIAAASIIAKVSRDRMMDEYDKIYPQYLFAKNKGYGTKEHIDAIKKYGLSPIHRKTFVKNFI